MHTLSLNIHRAVPTVLIVLVTLLISSSVDAQGPPEKRGGAGRHTHHADGVDGPSNGPGAPILMVDKGKIMLMDLDGGTVAALRGAKPRSETAVVIYNTDNNTAYVFDHDKTNRPAIYEANLERRRVRPFTRLPRLNTFCKTPEETEFLTLRRHSDLRFDSPQDQLCLTLNEPGSNGIGIEYVVNLNDKNAIKTFIQHDPRNLCTGATKAKAKVGKADPHCRPPHLLHQAPPRSASIDLKVDACGVRVLSLDKRIPLASDGCEVKLLGTTASGRYAAVEFTREKARVWRFIDIQKGKLLDTPNLTVDEDTPRSWSPSADAVIIDGTLYRLGGKSVALNRSAIFVSGE